MERIKRVKRTRKISVSVTEESQKKIQKWANKYDMDLNNFMVLSTLEKIERLESETNKDIVLNEILGIMKENQERNKDKENN